MAFRKPLTNLAVPNGTRNGGYRALLIALVIISVVAPLLILAIRTTSFRASSGLEDAQRGSAWKGIQAALIPKEVMDIANPASEGSRPLSLNVNVLQDSRAIKNRKMFPGFNSMKLRRSASRSDSEERDDEFILEDWDYALMPKSPFDRVIVQLEVVRRILFVLYPLLRILDARANGLLLTVLALCQVRYPVLFRFFYYSFPLFLLCSTVFLIFIIVSCFRSQFEPHFKDHFKGT